MTPAADRLAQAFVEAALELHRRRLWDELPPDALFLLRVPEEEHALAANVVGHARTEYGLTLTRGEQAFQDMARLALDLDPERHFGPECDLLAVCLEPLASIPEEFRAPLHAARFNGRRDRIAPWSYARRPFGRTRPPARGDLRKLVWALRGILAAADAGELRPTALDTRRRSVLMLAVGGELRAPTVEARVVPWPDAVERPALPPLLALPADLEHLPRRDERWLMTLLPLPLQIDDEPGARSAVLVLEETSERMVGSEILHGADLGGAAGALAAAFRGEGGDAPPGLPREITFGDESLHDALAPALAQLGVGTALDLESPLLAGVVANLHDGLRAIADADRKQSRARDRSGERTPETLAEWKAAEWSMARRLSEEVRERDLFPERALARYFGSEGLAERVLEELTRFDPLPAFVEWLVADYRATRRSVTLVEKLLARKRGISPAERALLEARRAAELSLYRVDSCEPGALFEVEDVLDGRRRTVQDRAMSGCGLEGFVVPLRLLRVADWHFPVIAGPVLGPLQVERALWLLERHGLELTPEGLRREAHLVGGLWRMMLAGEGRRPTIRNTDGDLLELHTATFRVADPAALCRALEALPDVEPDEPGSWTWARAGGPAPGLGQNTVLGRLELFDDRLVLEVNSARRFERARGWLERLAGVRFERAGTRSPGDGERPLDDRLPGPPPEPIPPAMRAEIERMMHEMQRAWLDEPVPVLGGLTPRAACATADGRRRVERLIRTMPSVSGPGGPIEPPRRELLEELGLGTEAPDGEREEMR